MQLSVKIFPFIDILLQKQKRGTSFFLFRFLFYLFKKFHRVKLVEVIFYFSSRKVE